MVDDERNLIKLAHEYWQSGLPLEAGRLIFENLPRGDQPRWASRILRMVLGKSGVSLSPIDDLLSVCDNQAEWAAAKSIFSVLRKATLGLEKAWIRSRKQELMLRQLYLAENIAKVVYNASKPTDEFDEDSGWWVAACLKTLVDWWDDEEFAEQAWSALYRQGD